MLSFPGHLFKVLILASYRVVVLLSVTSPVSYVLIYSVLKMFLCVTATSGLTKYSFNQTKKNISQ